MRSICLPMWGNSFILEPSYILYYLLSLIQSSKFLKIPHKMIEINMEILLLIGHTKKKIVLRCFAFYFIFVVVLFVILYVCFMKLLFYQTCFFITLFETNEKKLLVSGQCWLSDCIEYFS